MKEIRRVTDDERVYDGYLKVDKATFTDGDEEFDRFKVSRPDAACAILYNIDLDSIVLVRQHRYPMDCKVLEAVAGKIDSGETPEEAIKREVLEEMGYDISKKTLGSPYKTAASPGYSDEFLYAFFIEVENSDRVSSGGGLESERESIEVVNVGREEFRKMLRNNEIMDAKTVVASYIIGVPNMEKYLPHH